MLGGLGCELWTFRDFHFSLLTPPHHPQIARTELQTEMIAETNRKRRKLERDRRTVERPPGGAHT